ncbi:MAG: transcription initiation factor IIB family protein [Desulfurococcaceae archaeon]
MIRCHVCKNTSILFDAELQAYVCPSCGLVIDEKPFYQGHESFDKDGHVPRYSGSFTHRVHDHGVGSTEISGSIKYHIKQGRTWVARNIDARINKENRKVVKALKELNDLVKRVKPPKSVSETAGEILQKVIKNLNVKEQTLRKIVIASLYMAYKVCGLPRPAKIFVKEVGAEESDLWEGIRKIREVYSDAKIQPEAFEPRYYVNYIVTKLSMPSEVAALASELLANLKEGLTISGKSPAGLAAAAVYLAGILANHRRNQLEVGSVIGQTDVAVRNSYDVLVRSLDIEVLL